MRSSNGNKVWYAVMMDRGDEDWGTGSYNKAEAIRMAKRMGAEFILMIDDGDDPVAIGEISL